MKVFTDPTYLPGYLVYDEPLEWPELKAAQAAGYQQIRIPCYHIDSSSSLPTPTDFVRAITNVLRSMTWSYKTIWTFLCAPDDADGIRKLRRFQIVKDPTGTIIVTGKDNKPETYKVIELARF